MSFTEEELAEIRRADKEIDPEANKTKELFDAIIDLQPTVAEVEDEDV